MYKIHGEVQFEPSLDVFSQIIVYLNAGSNTVFSSPEDLNFGLNFGPVLPSSCLNFGSGLDFGITTCNCFSQLNHHYPTTSTTHP